MDLLRCFRGAFRKLILGRVGEVLNTPVGEIMSKNSIFINSKESLGVVAQVMKGRRAGSLFAVNGNGSLLGIIIEGDPLLALSPK